MSREPRIKKQESREQKAERSKRKAIKKEVGMSNAEVKDNSAFDTPHSAIKELPTDNLKLQTEQMEVHHHPDLHHEKKAWKEYILEGLMIFLAVTMGFFAETMRENISESGKAKELAKSLYQEVYADSVNMQYRLSLRMQKEQQINYFRKYVKDSSLVHLSNKFYPSFFWTFAVSSAIQFTPNDGILNQLRNSGSLLYFKSIELQNSISSMNVVILNLRNRNSQEDAFIEGFARPFMQRYYNFDWEDELTQYGRISGLQAILQAPGFRSAKFTQIRNVNNFDRGDAEALATHYMLLSRITKLLFYDPYIKANHHLLQVLRKEYHLKDE